MQTGKVSIFMESPLCDAGGVNAPLHLPFGDAASSIPTVRSDSAEEGAFTTGKGPN
jgi:hypothetical protein